MPSLLNSVFLEKMKFWIPGNPVDAFKRKENDWTFLILSRKDKDRRIFFPGNKMTAEQLIVADLQHTKKGFFLFVYWTTMKYDLTLQWLIIFDLKKNIFLNFKQKHIEMKQL